MSERAPESVNASNHHTDSHGNAANSGSNHHDVHHGNAGSALLRFVNSDDDNNPTVSTDVSISSKKREEEPYTEGQLEELEDIHVAVKCEISTVYSRFGIKALTELVEKTNKEMIQENIKCLKEMNTELQDTYSRQVEQLTTQYEEKLVLCENNLTRTKREMDEMRQRYEQNLSKGGAEDSQTAKDVALDEAMKLLEEARDEERQAKLNLEIVLQDNYRREEEILRLNRLLQQKESTGEMEIWKTKERFDECLVQTLEERNAQILESKKKIEELELKLTELQTGVKGTQLLENNFQDDLEALQLERDALRQTNEKYVRLISDYLRMSFLLEQRTNTQLSSSRSSSRVSSGFQHSPVPGQPNRWQLSDVSADEQGSSVASTADEGLEVSRCFADGLFPGAEFDTECEEAAKEASVSIQRSFDRLVDALGQSTSHSDETQKLKDLLRSAEHTNKDLMDVCEEIQEKLNTESSAVARLTEKLHVTGEELFLVRKANSDELSQEPKNGGDKDELISSLYRTVEDLEKELNGMKQKATDLQKKNQELEKITEEFQEVREDEESIKSKFYEQLILISSLKSQLDEQKLTTNEYMNDAKNVAHWKEIMEQEKESSEAKDKELNDLKKEVTDLQQQIINNHVELEKFRVEVEICKKQRMDSELQLTESHKKEVLELNGVLKEKESILLNLTTQLQSKQNELETLTYANSQLKHHYEIETNRLREQLEEKQSLLEIQIDEMSSLQGQLDRKEVKISQLTDELDSSEEDLARLKQLFDTGKKEFTDLTLKMENEILSLTSQLNEEKVINVEKTGQLETLERELDNREKELEELRKEQQRLLHQIDKLEADVSKLKAKLDDRESEIELTKEVLENNEGQMKVQLQKIEEMKRHHKKEVQDLLEDKEKELRSLNKIQLEDLVRNKQMEVEELESRHRKDLEHLLKTKENEIVDLDLRHQKEIEDLRKNKEKDLEELKSRHVKDLEALLNEKEKELKELESSHTKKLENLCREKEKELDSIRSKHLEEMDEQEKSIESQRQRQLQKLKEKHKEELSEMEDEMKRDQEVIQRLEMQIAESAKKREVENIELNARHAKELNESQKAKENHEKEMQNFQNELSKSHKFVQELKQKIADIEVERSEEIKHLSDKNSQTVDELKLALKMQNDEKLKQVADKNQTALNEVQEEVTKLNAIITELKKKISEAENRRERENVEAEIRRTRDLKEMKLTIETQNDQQLQIMARKHEQVICEMDEKLKKLQKQIQELKQTVKERETRRDQELREASVTHDREKDVLRSAMAKENERRLDEIIRRHRQEVENIHEELTRSKDSAKELENRYRRELREKNKEMNEASTRHAQELEALRVLLQSENEVQFKKLSEKYEQKFHELRQELEKNNSLMREMEEKQSRKTEEMKNLLSEVTLRNTNQLEEVMDDMKTQHEQELKEKLNQCKEEIRKLQEELHGQQQVLMKEKESGEERLRELLLKHSGEVEELKAMHQRYLDEAVENYRREMGDLRKELCKSRDILKDLNAEHSRELAQLREELKYSNKALHDSFPARSDSDAMNLEMQNHTGSLQEAWKLERKCLLAEIAVFQNLLKEIGHDYESKESESMDWRTDVLTAVHDILTKRTSRTTVSDIYLPVASENASQELNTWLQTKMAEQEQFYSQGLDQVLAVDRKSMLDEIDDLRQQIATLQQELLDDNKNLSDKLSGLEIRFKKRQKRLKNQLNAAEAQLSDERDLRSELQSTIDLERLFIAQLKDQLNQELDSAEHLKEKISKLQLELDDSETALKEERTKLVTLLCERDEERRRSNGMSDFKSKEQFLSEQSAEKSKHEPFWNELGYGQTSEIIESLKLELLQEKEEHRQVKHDLEWERNQRNNLENKIKSLWEKIGSLDSDSHLQLVLETDLHTEKPMFLDNFYYSMRREDLLSQCEQLQRLVAKFRDDLSKCSIISKDTSMLNEELMSVCQSLDNLIRNGDHVKDFGMNLSSRLLDLSKRCLKAEEHQTALIYQKRYLLLLIGGFQDCEQETLAAIARLGAYPTPAARNLNSRAPMPLTRFRRMVQTVIAIIRLQNLAKRWGSFDGDAPRQMSSLSTWRTLTSGIGTGRENQSFSSLPPVSFISSEPSSGKENLLCNHHCKSSSPIHRSQAVSRTAPRAFDDDIMSRSCDFGSERLSLVYSHYPPSPTRRSAKRRCTDDSECIRRQRLSKRSQSADFTRSRKLPVRPTSTYLW